MRFNEQVLLFENRGDGPVVSVRRVSAAVFKQGISGDIVNLTVHDEKQTLLGEYQLAPGQHLPLNVPSGFIRATRHAGSEPVTVVLECGAPENA